MRGLINRNERVLYMKIHDALRHLFLYRDTLLFFALLRVPLRVVRNEKWRTNFQRSDERSKVYIYIYRAGFSSLFELCSPRSIKNKFRTRASIFSPIDDDSRSIIKIHLLDSRCSFLFRERERGNSVMLAFLLETISYRVSRAKLSCCSTRFLASFFCRVFLTSGSKVW